MRIGGPGVGPVHAGHEVGPARIRSRPQAERSVHVDPGSGGSGRGDDGLERVAVASVDVAGLADDERSFVQRRELIGDQAASVIGGDVLDLACTDPRSAQRLQCRDVDLGRRDDSQGRGAGEAALVHTPSRLVQERVAGSEDAGEVGDRGAAAERGDSRRRQAEQLHDPSGCDLVESSGDR